MPPVAIAALTAFELAIKAAPHVREFATKAKEYFRIMFAADLITIDQQAALHERVDKVCEAALKGKVPDAWTVEPNPQ